jgi:site-specific DNA recombinase
MLSRVQRQISKLIDAYSDGLNEKGEFEPRIRDAGAHLEKLQVETHTQEQLQAQLLEMRQVIGQLEAFDEQVRGQLGTADWTVQRQLISSLVKRVEIGDDEVRVVYRVDCDPARVRHTSATRPPHRNAERKRNGCDRPPTVMVTAIPRSARALRGCDAAGR